MSRPADTRPVPPRLTGAAWLRRAETQAVFAALAAAGHEGRAVGGAVRNSLLGEPVVDVDIATPATPEEVIAAAEKAGLRSVATGLAHGTITIISGHQPYEVTTLRRDVATFGRHATVAYSTDWGEDARRRDFTMNALYCGADGTVYDPLGGYADLQARRVRFIGDPEARIREDYLRILRFFRFMAHYGAQALDHEGLNACVRARAGLDVLSGERVRQELVRLIVGAQAVEAVRLMLDYGVLTEIVRMAPRPALLARAIAIEAAAGLAADPMRRLSALLVAVPEDAGRLADRLRLSNAERETLGAIGPGSVVPSDVDVRACVYRQGKDRTLAEIVRGWTHDLTVATDDRDWLAVVREALTWTVPKFPLSGADVLARGVAPGVEVGTTLRAIEARWIAGGFKASRAELLTDLDAEIARQR